MIIPTYNRAELIARAIESVLAQTLPPMEVLVIDDGSTDETEMRVRALAAQDDRVVYRRIRRSGAPRARNFGLGIAKGEVIAFQDSDDEWEPEFLEELVPELAVADVVFSSSRVELAGGDVVFRPSTFIADPGRALLRTNVISTQTAVVRRDALSGVQFDPRLKRFQDWDLWLTLVGRARFAHVDKCLVRQYQQSDSLTACRDAQYSAIRVIVAKHWLKMLRDPASLLRNVARAVLGRRLRR